MLALEKDNIFDVTGKHSVDNEYHCPFVSTDKKISSTSPNSTEVIDKVNTSRDNLGPLNVYPSCLLLAVPSLCFTRNQCCVLFVFAEARPHDTWPGLMNREESMLTLTCVRLFGCVGASGYLCGRAWVCI